jgi:hypothetical protein
LLLPTTCDHPTVSGAVATSGADGLVLERPIATDLLPAVDAVLRVRPRACRSASQEADRSCPGSAPGAMRSRAGFDGAAV